MNELKVFLKIVAIGLGALGVVFLLIFMGNALGLFNLQFWGTKYQNARYQIFKNAQPYQQGMIQDLQNMRMKYLDAGTTEAEKDAIRATVIQRFGGFDYRTLPPDLQSFYLTMKGSR